METELKFLVEVKGFSRTEDITESEQAHIMANELWSIIKQGLYIDFHDSLKVTPIL